MAWFKEDALEKIYIPTPDDTVEEIMTCRLVCLRNLVLAIKEDLEAKHEAAGVYAQNEVVVAYDVFRQELSNLI